MNLFRLLSLILVISLSSSLFARAFRVSEIPNGLVKSCANCHVNPDGGGIRNDFGKLVEKSFLSAPGSAGHVKWGPVLASYDADGDGISNGAELQDPLGLWKSGQPDPGKSSLVTLPGSFVNSPAFSIPINFTGFAPHSGQKIQLRVIDKLNFQEVDRITLPYADDNFAFSLDGLLSDHSYWIDFYADLNGNGVYDAPPTDHAWRIELNNPVQTDTINFTHNTNFTDIDWPAQVSVVFSEMVPHTGQLVELRVVDEFGVEAGRKRIEYAASDFVVNVPGIKAGIVYNIDFFVDLNGNGMYDAPPADHAWRITFTGTGGDTTIQFEHNTNFTDISWENQMFIVLHDMTPHSGEMFAARVTHFGHEGELSRIIIPSVPGPNFVITFPNIEQNHDYILDFYADHNGNKTYDAPPVDYAWSDTLLTSPSGDFSFIFTHNTNFTDIQWPVTASINRDANSKPGGFALMQNYPNPFNPNTTFEFRLPATPAGIPSGRSDLGLVTFKIYDIVGNEVATLVNEVKPAGIYNINFNASNLASGVYFYQLRVGNFVETKKMILLK